MIEPASRPLMTTTEVAERFGVSRDVVDSLVRDGVLRPHPAFARKRWKRFPTVEVERVLAGDLPIEPDA